jgi:hypothetical protein
MLRCRNSSFNNAAMQHMHGLTHCFIWLTLGQLAGVLPQLEAL